VLISVTVLPSHFALAASRGTWSFEIKVESMPLRDFAENVANKHLETIPDDLSSTMCE
jgi:hypothetical protein